MIVDTTCCQGTERCAAIIADCHVGPAASWIWLWAKCPARAVLEPSRRRPLGERWNVTLILALKLPRVAVKFLKGGFKWHCRSIIMGDFGVIVTQSIREIPDGWI